MNPTDIREKLRKDSEIIIRESIKRVLPDEAVKRALSGKEFRDYIFSDNNGGAKTNTRRIILVSVGKAAWQMAKAACEICGDIITEGIVITKHGYSMGEISINKPYENVNFENIPWKKNDNKDGKTLFSTDENAELQEKTIRTDKRQKPGDTYNKTLLENKESKETIRIREAGHPVPDAETFAATKEALEMTKNLSGNDVVIFLLSGGGSALFEDPKVSSEALQDVTNKLLACGADITEINTIRKRLSNVKGGRFALHCAPAKIYTVILSDIIGDPIDMIVSGPAYPDSSTCDMTLNIVEKYGLELDEEAMECLSQETPKSLDNVMTVVTGSVRELCRAAAEECEKLGYAAEILTDSLDCEAQDAGKWLGSMAREIALGIDSNVKEIAPVIDKQEKSYAEQIKRGLALIAGGETVVKLTGEGLGGRNQELALSAAKEITGICGAAVFSVGSDGTDGPTDAAGGYVDYETLERLSAQGINIDEVLLSNDSYHALDKVDGLIKTGPTGTNVNDVAVALIDR